MNGKKRDNQRKMREAISGKHPRRWLSQNTAGSPAPHFIGVGQALQKSKGVLSGRPSKYSLADILEEIKPKGNARKGG